MRTLIPPGIQFGNLFAIEQDQKAVLMDTERQVIFAMNTIIGGGLGDIMVAYGVL